MNTEAQRRAEQNSGHELDVHVRGFREKPRGDLWKLSAQRHDCIVSRCLRSRLKSFQLLPRKTPVTIYNGPTIQFSNARRHSIQREGEALTLMAGHFLYNSEN